MLTQCPAMLEEIKEMKKVLYREVIGSMMYAALGTRPDIAFAVLHLSQFMQNPRKPHWEAVKRVLHYLKGTQNVRLVLGDGDETSEVWACTKCCVHHGSNRLLVRHFLHLLN